MKPAAPSPVEFQTQFPFKINCGSGSGSFDIPEIGYNADTFIQDGQRVLESNFVNVSGTSEIEKYRTGVIDRDGDGFEYVIPGIPDGRYMLTLFFIETEIDSVGQRVFDITWYGDPLIIEFDPYRLLSATNTEISLIIPVQSYGGIVRLGFQSVVGQAKVNAIELDLLTPEGRINCGGGDLKRANQDTTVTEGVELVVWEDKYFTGGTRSIDPRVESLYPSSIEDIFEVNTVDHAGWNETYYTARVDDERTGFNYTLPIGVVGIEYVVKLHFIETWAVAENQRLFDIRVGDLATVNSYDIFAEAGGTDTPTTLTFEGILNDTELKIELVSYVDVAIINGIEWGMKIRPSTDSRIFSQSEILDTYVSIRQPQSSFGDAQKLEVSSYSYGLIKIPDLENSIPEGTRVIFAYLAFTTTEQSDGTIRIFRMETSWNEQATWNDFNFTEGGKSIGNDAVHLPSYFMSREEPENVVYFDVTGDVALWYQGGADNEGWVMTNIRDEVRDENYWGCGSSQAAQSFPILYVQWESIE